jgi:RNase P/RNase MRP subunit POP5
MKPKLKSLKPSAKENKRYLLIRGKNLKENIEKAILDFSGVLGMSKTGLAFIETNEKENTAIIAVNREAVNLARASFAVSNDKITTERISGTLKGLGKKR